MGWALKEEIKKTIKFVKGSIAWRFSVSIIKKKKTAPDFGTHFTGKETY